MYVHGSIVSGMFFYVQVGAVDLLCSGVGEICGGSVREERLHVLQPRLQQMGLEQSYNWLATACILL